MNRLSIPLAIALSIGMLGVASAQSMGGSGMPPATQQTTTTTTTVYNDGTCGAWQEDTWVDNGTCANEATLHKHERVAGTITIVKGHLVTVQQADKNVTINDQSALNNQSTGKVAVGRNIVAHGYWDSGTFYATLLTTSDVAPANAP